MTESIKCEIERHHDMQLRFTLVVDQHPQVVECNLHDAVSSGLDAAADRAASPRVPTDTAELDHGVRVTGGLEMLEGSEIRVSGVDRLTELEVSVPWSQADAGTTKLWAAIRFADVVGDRAAMVA